MRIVASTMLLVAFLMAGAGCFHPRPTVKDVTARASEYGTLYKGQKLRLRQDAITDGSTAITAYISLREGYRTYRKTVSEFKSSPSSYPGRSIITAGTLLEVERLRFRDNVTWSTLAVEVRILSGPYKGSLMWLQRPLLSSTTHGRPYYRPNPTWLSVEEHDAG